MMTNESMTRTPVTILMADDDIEDTEFTQLALEESSVESEFRSVGDGEELLRYLRREGEYENAESSPRPSVILLDLQMPRMGGLDVLKTIKEDKSLSAIPVLVFSTSRAPIDIDSSYDFGASSFVSKPNSFDDLVDTLETLGDYWFGVVQLPSSTPDLK